MQVAANITNYSTTSIVQSLVRKWGIVIEGEAHYQIYNSENPEDGYSPQLVIKIQDK